MKAGFEIGYNREYLHLIEIYASMYDIIWLLDEIFDVENDIRYRSVIDELRVYIGLQNIEQYVYKFSNVQTCIDRICTSNDRNVILFISRNQPLNEADYSLLCELQHVEYIYQFGLDNPCRKMRGEVLTNVNQLLQIESDLQIIPFDIRTTLIENLDNETRTLFIRQLLIELLQKIPCTESEKDVFIDFFVDSYGQTTHHLNQIQQYQEQHAEKPAIWFYTDDSCIHHFVNRVFREKNPTSMIKIHYFINQLYSELERLYILQLSTRLRYEMQVYRGKRISVEELHRFQRVVKRLVVTNSFVSTSENRTVSLRFSGEGKLKEKKMVSVLFVIKIAAWDNPTKPMAFVDPSLPQDYENELLLSSGMILSIYSVKKIKKNLWQIELVRDVYEFEFEKQLYLKFWDQICVMNPSLSMAYLLKKFSSQNPVDEYCNQNLVDEYCNQMADLLQRTDRELSSQLRQLARNSNFFRNYLPVTCTPTNQIITLNPTPSPELPASTIVSLISLI